MIRNEFIEPIIKNIKISNLKIKDLTGEVFGKLTVMKKHDKRDQNNRILWDCLCECGKKCIINGNHLTRGSRGGSGIPTRSCGCLRNNAHNKILDREHAIWKHLYNSTIVRRSKSKKWGIIIDLEHFKYLSQEPCNFCGLSSSNSITDRCDSNNILYFNGIDRLDSNLGYTKENSVPCCRYCNTAKNTMCVEEFMNYIKRVYEFNLPKD